MNTIHQIEPELRNPPPRRVFPRESMKIHRPPQVVAWSLALMFLVGALVGTCQLVGKICLLTLGKQTTGHVTHHADASPGSEERSYYINYTFRVGEAEHQVHYDTSATEYEATSAGEAVPVKYLALGTNVYSIALLPERSLLMKNALGLAITLVFGGFTAVIVYAVCIMPLIRRSLYREGETVVGKITNKKVDNNEGATYTLHYEFTLTPLLSSRSVTGSVQIIEEEYYRANIGDELTILYNPRKPRINVSYLYGGYQVA